MREEIVPGGSGDAELTVTVPDQEPIQSRLLVALWLLVVAGRAGRPGRGDGPRRARPGWTASARWPS